MTPFQAFFLYLSLIVFAWGWFCGGHPERRAVMAILLAMIASLLVEDIGTERVRWAVIVVDLILLIYVLVMTLRIDRWWLMATTAALFLTMVAHAGMFLDPELSLRVNVATRWVFGVVVMLSLGGGVVERWLAREPAIFTTWLLHRPKSPT